MNEGPDLVTGGAGFIGSVLVEMLVAAGRRVRVLDDLSAGTRANLSDLPPDRVELIVGDVRDAGVCAAAVAGAARLFHLAGLGLRRSLTDPTAVHEVNATGTLRLLAAAHAAGVARFVHVSSSEVYGTAETVPMTEDHPLRPTTPYGASKLAGEAYARAWGLTHGLPVVVVRPFNAYGPRCHHEGDSGEVIPRFVLQALTGRPLTVYGDGRQTRDFTHVRDTARSILLAGEAAVVGRTLNVGSGAEVAVGDLAGMVAAATGRAARIDRAPARPGDVRRLLCDATAARAALGWTPTVPLAQGLAEVVAWYRAAPGGPEAAAAALADPAWRDVA